MSAQVRTGRQGEAVPMVRARVALMQVREVEVLGLTSDLTAPDRKVSAADHAIRIVVDRIRRIGAREMTADDLGSVEWALNTAPVALVTPMALMAHMVMAHMVMDLRVPDLKARSPKITVPNSTIRRGMARRVLAHKVQAPRLTVRNSTIHTVLVHTVLVHTVLVPKLMASNSTIRTVPDRRCAVPTAQAHKITVLKLMDRKAPALADVKRWVADLSQVVRRMATLNIVSRKSNDRPNDCSTKSATFDRNSGDPMPARVHTVQVRIGFSLPAPMPDLLAEALAPDRGPIEREPTRAERRELNSCRRWNDRGAAWKGGPKDRDQDRTTNVGRTSAQVLMNE